MTGPFCGPPSPVRLDARACGAGPLAPQRHQTLPAPPALSAPRTDTAPAGRPEGRSSTTTDNRSADAEDVVRTPASMTLRKENRESHRPLTLQRPTTRHDTPYPAIIVFLHGVVDLCGHTRDHIHRLCQHN